MTPESSSSLKYNLQFSKANLAALNTLVKQFNSIKPLIEFQQEISKVILPKIDMSPLIDAIDNIRKTNETIARLYSNEFSNLSQTMKVFLDSHQKNVQRFVSLSLQNINTSDYLSDSDSAAVNTSTSNIISILEEYEYPEPLEDAKQSIVEVNKEKQTLTWEQVLIIITFLIQLFTFVQSQLPNKQVTDIQDSLNQILEVETKQLNLLEKHIE